MKNARSLILEFLQKNHTASAAELSRSLQLTKADIRYHLKSLLSSKMIEKSILRRSFQKGRPTQLFRIARQALPENITNLAEAMLVILKESGSEREMVDNLAVFFASQIPTQKQPAQQLNRLVAYLTEHGHKARWEAYTSGPRILFRNCPYAQILAKHPELCAMDTQIISNYLGQPFEQTARIDPDFAKIPACIFTLKQQPG